MNGKEEGRFVKLMDVCLRDGGVIPVFVKTASLGREERLDFGQSDDFVLDLDMFFEAKQEVVGMDKF
jgi:hypothetical protein